ncbi:MAG: fibronectin type III domain-containing protein [Solirubrobacteraceae bacterium]|nr:fibronectin type III domain-containing protein [Solirubrobacteraceae bacterium]
MRRPSHPAPFRAVLAAMAVAIGLAWGASGAFAAAGDLVVVDPPAPLLPDDSATPYETAISGNGRFVAVTEGRDCVELAPDDDPINDCYDEQQIWRYDLQTGARVKVSTGGFALGGAREPALSYGGSVAAWTAFYWLPDADTTRVFRSEPGSDAPGADVLAGTDTSLPEFISHPSISADGGSLALQGQAYGGTCASSAFAWSAGSPTVGTVAGGCAEAGAEGTVGDAGRSPELSADGGTLVFAGTEGLYRYDVPARTWQLIPVPAEVDLQSVGIGDSRLALSGDGSTVAYITRGPEGELTLWATDVATGASTSLASVPAGPAVLSTRTPAISANGRYIAYDWGIDGEAASGLRTFVADRTTGASTLVSTRPGLADGFAISAAGTGPGISADGRYVTLIASDARDAVPDAATPSGPHAIRADVLGAPADTVAPPKPNAIKVSQSAGSVQLTWPAVAEPRSPVTYRIRQRPIAGGPASVIGTRVQSGTTLTLPGLTAGARYRFAVQAEDVQGNRSTATTVTFTAAGQTDPTAPEITAPADPYTGTGEAQTGGAFTIEGADLANVTGVLIGGRPATGLSISATQITGTAPAGADAASVPVTVLGPFGAEAAGRFLYQAAG